MPDEPVPPPDQPQAGGTIDPLAFTVDTAAAETNSDDAKRDTVVAANIGIAAGASAGIAATAGVMAKSRPETAAQTAAVDATTSTVQAAAAAKTGGAAAGTKVGAALLGAALVGGAILVGVGVTDDDSTGAQILEPVMDEGITGFDFANATIVPSWGGEHQLVDGVALHPGMEDIGVGYYLDGDPVFADIDGDNDLDAATLMTWRPAAGATTYSVYLWLWNDGEVEQVTDQLEVEYHGYLADLDATETAFQVTRMTLLEPSKEEFTETITFGLSGGDVVRTDPVSAVAPCPQSDGMVPAPVDPGLDALVAPRDDAAPVQLDWTSGGSQDSDPDGDGWVIAELRDDAGTAACAWVRLEDILG